MRLARVRTAEGIVTGEYDDGEVTDGNGTTYRIDDDAELLAPCQPSALYCVGRNYAATLELKGYDRPTEPSFFIKPPVSVVGPGAPIPYPGFSEEVTYAGELAAVLDRECRHLEPAEVPAAVRGYTVLNDMDALDQPSVTARKAFDGSGPLGPWIETDLDPTDVDMRTVINGETRQEANTSDMIFGPYEVISFLSRRLTLLPGDVVSFGSPANPGTVEPGDEIAITYDGIGTLRNDVVAPSA